MTSADNLHEVLRNRPLFRMLGNLGEEGDRRRTNVEAVFLLGFSVQARTVADLGNFVNRVRVGWFLRFGSTTKPDQLPSFRSGVRFDLHALENEFDRHGWNNACFHMRAQDGMRRNLNFRTVSTGNPQPDEG